jgi:beta-galactosidase
VPVITRPWSGLDAFLGWGPQAVFEALHPHNTKCAFKGANANGATLSLHYILTTPLDGQDLPSRVCHRLTLHENGFLEVETDYALNPNLMYVPRAGMEFILSSGFESLTYYSHGENESYSDRVLSAPVGVYESTVTAQHFPFSPTSECGGHTGTRWLALRNDKNNEIKIMGARPFHFDARHNSITDYIAARYDHELQKREETWLHIDAAHMGIGSDMAWSTYMPPAHSCEAGAYHLKFYVQFN